MTFSNRAAPKWWHGWSPIVLLPGAVMLLAPTAWPPWVAMWLLAIAIYCGCKWLTWRRTPVDGVAGWKHAAYLLAWPGLDPGAFLCGHPEHAPRAGEWVRGASNGAGPRGS